MRDQVEIVNAIDQSRGAGMNGALATIIGVIGSAYRHPGAKMFIDEQGNTTGMISGGCLENDVAHVARQVIESSTAMRKQYVMEEDLVWGLGLGCPGTVELYIEPFSRDIPDEDPRLYWMRTVQEEMPCVLCTVFPSNVESKPIPDLPARLFVSQTGDAIGDLGKAAWNQEVIGWASGLLSLPHAKSISLTLQDGSHTVFLDVYQPPPELMIFGAGHDAIPLVEMGSSVGLSVTVIDPREGYNTVERFPGARKRVIARPSEQEQIQIGTRTYVVIMNHHLERDQEALKLALHSKTPYVGLLGPRKRCDRIMRAWEEQGVPFSADELARLYNPIGLNLGAESPEEIAVSIISEILAVQRRHDGRFLRDLSAIHQYSAVALL
jgi:xanthine dehydrogenase accessory factor